MRRAKEIQRYIKTLEKGEQWLIIFIDKDLVGMWLYEKAPDNKYEWAIDPYHDNGGMSSP